MNVRHQVPLAPLTTLGIGGSAETLVEHSDHGSFFNVVQLVHEHGGQPVALGGGSNVLASDPGCQGPVIHMTTCGITLREAPDGDGVLVTAEAGHPLQDLVETTVAECLTGIETLWELNLRVVENLSPAPSTAIRPQCQRTSTTPVLRAACLRPAAAQWHASIMIPALLPRMRINVRP